MALTVEDGSGVAAADAYAATATVDSYWNDRAHRDLAATWTAASAADKEGAIREATTYLDATWGPYYRGKRKGYVQGLLWPRMEALDEAGFPLPDMPQEVVTATCELAARALSETLAEDFDRGNMITRKREKVGPLEEQTEYAAGARPGKRYGVVDGVLAPVLNGTQPGAPTPSWAWQ